MIFWYLAAAVLVLVIAGCAVAIGSGATACLDFTNRAGIAVDGAASRPELGRKTDGGGGINCSGVTQ